MEIVGIAEARRRLPELATHVVQHVGDVVVIENQRTGERAVLTAESYLKGLEAIVEETQKQGGRPFVLKGSMTTGLDGEALEAALAELRSERNAAWHDRLANLT